MAIQTLRMGSHEASEHKRAIEPAMFRMGEEVSPDAFEGARSTWRGKPDSSLVVFASSLPPPNRGAYTLGRLRRRRPRTVNRPLIHIDRESCLQLERSMSREWLETDGRGGFASSSILMCPTRRYHGLLVTPPPGSVKRHVFLSRFEETFHGGGKTFSISMARYPGLWSPPGHQGIESFELVPFPSWHYVFGNATIERELLLVRGEAIVLVRYRVNGQQNDVELRLRPLLPCREADALTFENQGLDKRTERPVCPELNGDFGGGIRCQPYASLPPVSITVSGNAHFEADPVWYKSLEYTADIARGYDGHEDQWSPGVIHVALEAGADVIVSATIGEAVRDPAALWKKESASRRAALIGSQPGLRGVLSIAADDFVYRAPEHRTTGGRIGVIAGYPWFGEWGRDTFISLPGLLLSRGRVAECGQALEGALAYLKRGLMPNIFGANRDDSDYGSADASLWFVRAVRLYERAAGEGSGVARRFVPALTEIAESYMSGTDLGLRADEAGLLHAGRADLNATWMDARTSHGPVTPRDGCAVEINALWCFLLEYLEDIARRTGDASAAREWGQLERRASTAFLERFWLPNERYLADVWKDGLPDKSVRPNMVIAAALEFSPLSRSQRADVVECAESQLVTPFGLRTLEPRDPAYVGRYGGGPEERDRAYHQGTVWPWLIGFYCEAWLRAKGRRRDSVEHLRELLDRFAEKITGQGLNHISEVMDGDPPHRPGGTIAQAWNTGEILRAYALLEERSQ